MFDPVMPIGDGQYCYSSDGVQPIRKQRGTSNHAIEDNEPDSFVRSKQGGKASRDGKFSLLEAGKNFLKGIISPVTAVLNHPLQAALMIGGGLALATIAPITIPLMLAAGGAFGIYQAGKGALNIVSNLAQGRYDDAEKAFEDVGAGTSAIGLTALGLRGGAAVAAEAKASTSVLQAGGTASEALEAGVLASRNTRNLTLLEAGKENLSLITSSEGRTALMQNLKPSVLLKNGKTAIAQLRNFPSTIKRWLSESGGKQDPALAKLSDDEILVMAQKQLDMAYEKMGIEAELRPKLSLLKGENANLGGRYNSGNHGIGVNPDAVRKGVYRIEDIMPHEAEHGFHAMLRSRLSQEELTGAINEQIVQGVRQGEATEILSGGGMFGPQTVKTPQMSAGMRGKVADVVQEMLPEAEKWMKTIRHGKGDFSNYMFITDEAMAGLKAEAAQPFAGLQTRIGGLMDEGFIAQYGSREEALANLTDYIGAQNFRSQAIGKLASIPEEGELGVLLKTLRNKPLQGSEKELALQSAREFIDTLEGNARNGGIFKNMFGTNKADYTHYFLSGEEIAAKQASLQNRMTMLTDQIKTLDANNPAHVSQLRQLIADRDALEVSGQMLNEGRKLYGMSNQFRANPDDALLQQMAETETKLLGMASRGRLREANPTALGLSDKGISQAFRQFAKGFWRDMPKPANFNWGLLPRRLNSTEE